MSDLFGGFPEMDALDPVENGKNTLVIQPPQPKIKIGARSSNEPLVIVLPSKG